ncbi:F186A-like protein [Mya arenaria]|uniref:F186A-like protein n=1 Tax=Mya arenaria TaxID=6604 RepID=A0ABY7DAC6_MYAAR|nr:F186A-like protein [Mya arenaria]
MEHKRRGPYGKRKLKSGIGNPEISLNDPDDGILTLNKNVDGVLEVDDLCKRSRPNTIKAVTDEEQTNGAGARTHPLEVGIDYADVSGLEDDSPSGHVYAHSLLRDRHSENQPAREDIYAENVPAHDDIYSENEPAQEDINLENVPAQEDINLENVPAQEDINAENVLEQEDDIPNLFDYDSDLDLNSQDKSEILNSQHVAAESDVDPLYPGASLTVGAIMLLLALFFTKHNIVGDGIQQLLNIFAIALPNGHKMCTSLHGFKSFFKNLKNPIVKHFYCGHCLGFIVNSQINQCPYGACKKQLNQDGEYFLEMPIDKQIASLLQQEGFYNSLQHRFKNSVPEKFCDIYDGSLYQKYVDNDGPLANPDNISFTFNTDGASIAVNLYAKHIFFVAQQTCQQDVFSVMGFSLMDHFHAGNAYKVVKQQKLVKGIPITPIDFASASDKIWPHFAALGVKRVSRAELVEKRVLRPASSHSAGRRARPAGQGIEMMCPHTLSGWAYNPGCVFLPSPYSHILPGSRQNSTSALTRADHQLKAIMTGEKDDNVVSWSCSEDRLYTFKALSRKCVHAFFWRNAPRFNVPKPVVSDTSVALTSMTVEGNNSMAVTKGRITVTTGGASTLGYLNFQCCSVWQNCLSTVPDTDVMLSSTQMTPRSRFTDRHLVTVAQAIKAKMRAVDKPRRPTLFAVYTAIKSVQPRLAAQFALSVLPPLVGGLPSPCCPQLLCSLLGPVAPICCAVCQVRVAPSCCTVARSMFPPLAVRFAKSVLPPLAAQFARSVLPPLAAQFARSMFPPLAVRFAKSVLPPLAAQFARFVLPPLAAQFARSVLPPLAKQFAWSVLPPLAARFARSMFPPLAVRFAKSVLPPLAAQFARSVLPPVAKQFARSVLPPLAARFARSVLPSLAAQFARSMLPPVAKQFARSVLPPLAARFARSMFPPLAVRFAKSVLPPLAAQFAGSVLPPLAAQFARSVLPPLAKQFARSVLPPLAARFARSVLPPLAVRFARSVLPPLAAQFARSVLPPLAVGFARSMLTPLAARFARSMLPPVTAQFVRSVLQPLAAQFARSLSLAFNLPASLPSRVSLRLLLLPYEDGFKINWCSKKCASRLTLQLLVQALDFTSYKLQKKSIEAGALPNSEYSKKLTLKVTNV